MATFIFDLDMTLLDTSALDSWRAGQMWPEVRSNLGRVRPFAIGTPRPHEVPGRLREQGHRVAVVTSSPKWYAERLIDRFGIETEVVVASGDTELHKPHPEPLLKALELLGESADNTYGVGDTPIDVEASYHAGVLSIGAGWGVGNFEELSSSAPDVLLRMPDYLCRFNELRQRGYFAEAICEGVEHKTHRGAFLPCGEAPRRYALGRYFMRGDPRCADSRLAASILKLKQEDGPASLFGRALASFVGELGWRADYIVPVPPKPGQERNRFEAVLADAAESLPSDSKVVIDGLKWVREVKNYKELGARERIAAIRGAFESVYQWGGRTVLLVDDVLTTAGTMAECARALIADKASEVRGVAFGRDQKAFVMKQCAKCGRRMRMRTNHTTGANFWGCSGYPEYCKHTEVM